MAQINIVDYRWAAIKTGRKAWRAYGRRTTLSQDDADAEALLALAECPRTFDPTKGHFGCYVKRAAYNAVRRVCEKASAYVVVDEVREAEPPSSIKDRSHGLREYLKKNPHHEVAIKELLSDARKPSKSALGVLGRIRMAVGEKPKRSRLLATPVVARMLGTVDRRVRALCEAGTLPAVRKAGEWRVSPADLRAYRRARAVAAINNGASSLEAAKKSGLAARSVRRIAKEIGMAKPAHWPKRVMVSKKIICDET